MATLFTFGNYVQLTPTQFNSYSAIRHSTGFPTGSVVLGFVSSGTVDFSTKLGSVAAEINGYIGADRITSGSGNDSLWGNAGNDTMIGNAGDDLLIGDWDDKVSRGNDMLYGGVGDDALDGGLGNDVLYGGDDEDLFFISDTNAGNDTFYGGTGLDQVLIEDLYGVDEGQFVIQKLILNAAASVEFLMVKEYDLKGTAGNDAIDLSGTSAYQNGDYSRMVFSINLLGGNDTFTGGNTPETILVAGGADAVSLGAGNDMLVVLDGNITGSTLNGGSGNDILVLGDFFGLGPVTLHQVTVTSLAFITSSAFESVTIQNDVQLVGTAGAETFSLAGAKGDLNIYNPILMLGGNDRFTAVGYQALSGSGVSVEGGTGNDTLLGSSQTDFLLGGAGNDSMVGGLGDDIYEVDSLNDIFVELAGQGTDQIRTSLSTFNLGLTFENLQAIGAGGLMGTGNDQRNQMTGAEGRDHFLGLAGDDGLDGGMGLDTMEGGLGNDTYYVTEPGDVLIEAANAGNDRVVANIQAWALGDNLEWLDHQIATAFLGIGNALNNRIISDAGNDTLRGRYGADVLISGSGDDLLDGGWGDDTLIGGLGNDWYISGVGTDRITEFEGQGIDTVVTLANALIMAENVENALVDASVNGAAIRGNGLGNLFTGSGGNDSFVGLDGNDSFVGGGGLDTFVGGANDDTYYFAATGSLPVIIETTTGGVDEIISAAQSTVLIRNVERLILTRGAGAVGIGNSQDNLLFGGAGGDRLEGGWGNDQLSGGAGNDTLYGGDGNDSFVMSDLSDLIIETASGGVDRMIAMISGLTVAAGVEEGLVGTDTGLSLTGGVMATRLVGALGNDTLAGQAGNDTLQGGGGADSLLGGLGDDTYIVDLQKNLSGDWIAADSVVEAEGAGRDTIVTNTRTAVLIVPHVEVLRNIYNGGTTTAMGSINLGRATDDVIIADISRDTLDGGDGSDTLTGGLGADVFGFRTPMGVTNIDWITDFNPLEDRIGLTYFGTGFGVLAASAFKDLDGRDSRVDSDDRIIYDRSAHDANGTPLGYGILYRDRDGWGPAEAEAFAIIEGSKVLTNTNFISVSSADWPI